MWHSDFRQLMGDYLRERQSGNTRFSQRALARKLRISAGTLSDLLSGRRDVSPSMALTMLDRIPDADADRVERMRRLLRTSQGQRIVLAPDHYDLILEWSYLGILCLLELDGAPRTRAEIARRLGLTEDRAALCLKRLIETGMLRESAEGYVIEGGYFGTTDEIPNPRIVESHLHDMEKAASALRELPPARRDFISMTVAGDRARLSAAKTVARRFLEQAARALGGGERNEVFKISVQMYPLTRQDAQD